MIADSHCHLSSPELYQDIESVLKRAHDAGVSYFLNAGGKFDELKVQLDICHRFKNIWTVTGVHPHDSSAYADIKAEDVLKNTTYSKVVAIGECGLDYFYDFSPRDTQIKVFREMIKAAQESALPLIVHTREADADTIEILMNAYKKKPFFGEIHCYSSSLKLAKEALKIGFYISASGIITFNNAQTLRDNFKFVPMEKLLIETDSPYLAPVPMRGKIAEPSYIVHTAEMLAQIKRVTFEKVCVQTKQNFFKLFRKVISDD